MPQISPELVEDFERQMADIQVAMSKDDLSSSILCTFVLLFNILENTNATDEDDEPAGCCHDEISALTCIIRSLSMKGLIDSGED